MRLAAVICRDFGGSVCTERDCFGELGNEVLAAVVLLRAALWSVISRGFKCKEWRPGEIKEQRWAKRCVTTGVGAGSDGVFCSLMYYSRHPKGYTTTPFYNLPGIAFGGFF